MNENLENVSKKSGKGKNILIVILFLIIIGLLGFIVYDKVINKKEEPKPAEEKVAKEEKKEENLDEIGKELTLKLEEYVIDYYDNFENLDFTTVSDKDLMLGAFSYSIKNGNLDLKRQNVDDYFYNVFGRTLTTYPDLECWVGDGVIYKYNAESKEYQKDCGDKETCHAHGGLEGHQKSIIIKASDIQKEENKYILTVNKVFGNNLKDSDGYFYSDYKYENRITGLDSLTDAARELNPEEIQKVKDYYEQNYEQFKNLSPKYRYTFTKTGDDFFLTKFEVIK